jgi:hypothetical protein
VHSTAAASASGQSKQPSVLLLQLPLTSIPSFQVLTGSSLAADLLESNLSSEGNIPSELSAAGGSQQPSWPTPLHSSFSMCQASLVAARPPRVVTWLDVSCCSASPCGHLAGCQLHAHCGLAQG